jgi:hypothetical protein
MMQQLKKPLIVSFIALVFFVQKSYAESTILITFPSVGVYLNNGYENIFTLKSMPYLPSIAYTVTAKNKLGFTLSFVHYSFDVSNKLNSNRAYLYSKNGYFLTPALSYSLSKNRLTSFRGLVGSSVALIGDSRHISNSSSWHYFQDESAVTTKIGSLSIGVEYQRKVFKRLLFCARATNINFFATSAYQKNTFLFEIGTGLWL